MGLRKNLQNFAPELGFKFGVMKGFRKGITLGVRTPGSFYILGLQKWVANNLLNFASELGFKYGVMRGYLKDLTHGGNAS